MALHLEWRCISRYFNGLMSFRWRLKTSGEKWWVAPNLGTGVAEKEKKLSQGC